MPNPILICRTAWMHDYTGMAPMYSGAEWVRKKGHGDEIYNFLKGGRRTYGFVQFKGSMHIERLGASNDDDAVSSVDVVWTAPRRGGGVFVVGWYRNATVYRDMQKTPNDPRRKSGDGESRRCWWSITAQAKNVTRLEPEDRWFRIPAACVSQSQIAYVDSGSSRDERLKTRLRDMMAGRLNRPKPSSGAGRQRDPEKLLRVERAACAVVRKHYEAKGFAVTSVERDRVGWDLEAAQVGQVLKIEVKGCSGIEVVAELTPNEYKQSRARKHRGDYRICIVTRALTKPTLHVFGWNEDLAAWTDQQARTLAVEEKIAALVRLR